MIIRKSLLALILAAVASTATAQTTPTISAPIDAQFLHGLDVGWKMAMEHAKPIAQGCSYDAKSYSEGAIQQFGKVTLVCVERDWGVRGFAPGDSKAPRELVWEPLNSERLRAYRKATGLGQ